MNLLIGLCVVVVYRAVRSDFIWHKSYVLFNVFYYDEAAAEVQSFLVFSHHVISDWRVRVICVDMLWFIQENDLTSVTFVIIYFLIWVGIRYRRMTWQEWRAYSFVYGVGWLA